MKPSEVDGEIIAVFVDSNLGTHLALPTPPDSTVANLKSSIRREHLSCFAILGEIEVHALMVKRRSHFYHLSDVMPLRSAFQGVSGTWFLYMSATTLQNTPLPNTSIYRGQPSVSSDSDITECSRFETRVALGDNNRRIGDEEKLGVCLVTTSPRKILRVRMAGNITEEGAPANEPRMLESFTCTNAGREMASMTLSKEVSVTGIISRYFSDYDEVNSCRKKDGRESENTCNNNSVCSLMRDSVYSANQFRQKMMGESDTDTVGSISIAAANFSEEVKATKKSNRRTRKATHLWDRNRERRSRRTLLSPPSDKLQVGKKVIQAANTISLSCGRRKLSKPLFASRHGNMPEAQANGLARNLVFEIDSSED